MKLLLRLLSVFYGGLTSLRNALYDRGALSTYTSLLPVISVGNVTAGGNAKTPLVAFLCKELQSRGYQPVVLTRGYGGRTRGPKLVGPEDSIALVGDEALLLRRSTGCPVVVARRRALGARFAEKQQLGDVLVLDDGFQHRRLNRDLDIVTANIGSVEARADFISGNLLPYGRFREDRDRALRRADMLVFSERRPLHAASEPDQSLFRVVPRGVQLYRSSFETEGVFRVLDGVRLEPAPVVAFCGIANPEGFLATLEDGGFQLVYAHRFADHHVFTSAEIEKMKRLHPGVPLVCTEKDAIRIPEALLEGIHQLRISVRVAPRDAFVTEVCRALVKTSRARQRVVPVPPRTEKSSSGPT